MRKFLTINAAIAIILGLAACGDGGEKAAGGVVEVTLQEWSVNPAVDSVEAGAVTFRATNEGPNDPHELVVIMTDLDPDALPTTDEGGVDETGLEVIGEIEEFEPGTSQEATFTLEAGKYVLLCNVVETEPTGATESHYQQGMRTAFTVE